MKYRDIISRMSLEEKALLTTGKTCWKTYEIERLGIPSIFLSDGPHGLRKQLDEEDIMGVNPSCPATCFPTAATMACSWDVDLCQKLGEYLGVEAQYQNVQVLLGPGTNIKRDPLCGRNFEYFSEDPYLAGKLAASYIKGIQSQGVAACVKHFACNNQEQNRLTTSSEVDERALREIYLTAFEIAIKEAKVKTIMSSYNLLNGVYANENKHLLIDILRNEFGFDGVVVTDWGADNDRIEGLKALNSLEMPGCLDSVDEVIDAVKEGRLDESILDENVDLMLSLIFDLNNSKKENEFFDKIAHHNFAQKAAEESIVLLKNKHILPLDSSKKVALIGDFIKEPRYQGAGSSNVNATQVDSIYDLCQDSKINYFGYAQGYNRDGSKNKKLFENAINLAKEADTVVLAMGQDEFTEAEGVDRFTAKLPQVQIDLFDAIKKLNKEIVVLVSGGAYVELRPIRHADAILHCYLSGQAGAKAILNILDGTVNPSGKLAESYPIEYKDCPTFGKFPSYLRTAEYRESIFVGYRYYDTNHIKVQYPFGFGLSYTTFNYSNLVVNEKGVTFDLENTGSIEGKEVAQLYVGLPNSNILRPTKELKGFIKVSLKPGEKKQVHIPFDDKTFRYFNTRTNKWEIEKGYYEIFIGSSSVDIALHSGIKMEGTTSIYPYSLESLPSYKEGKINQIPDEEFEILLGRKITNGELPFINKRRNRIVVDLNTTVEELRYAKGWVGRTFAFFVRVYASSLKKGKDKTKALTVSYGIMQQPMRDVARMTGNLTIKQMEGLIMVFNGQIIKGLKKYSAEGKVFKKRHPKKKD